MSDSSLGRAIENILTFSPVLSSELIDETCESTQERTQIILDPKGAIDTFVASDTGEPWATTLRHRLRERLSGNMNKGYFKGLLSTAYSAVSQSSAQRENIVTAVLLYELEHRKELPDERYKNQTVLLTTASRIAAGSEWPATVISQYIRKSIPLEEALSITQSSANEMERRAFLANIAARQPGDEKVHNEIIENAVTLIEEQHLSFRQPTHYLSLFAVDRILTQLYAQKQYQRIMKIYDSIATATEKIPCDVDAHLHTAAVYGKATLTMAGLRSQNNISDLALHNGIWAKWMLTRVPALTRMHDQRYALHAAALVDVERAENESRQHGEREREERQQRERESVDRQIDELLHALPQARVNGDFAKNIQQASSYHQLPPSFIDCTAALFISLGKYSDLSINRTETIIDLHSRGGSPEKVQALAHVWMNTVRPRLLRELHALFIRQAETIKDAILQYCDRRLRSTTGSTTENVITKELEGIIDACKANADDAEDTREAYGMIAASLSSFLHIHREKTQEENITKVQKSFLFEQVTAKVNYLRTLYATCTGIALGDLEAHAVERDTGAMGMIFMGMSLSHRTEMRQTLTMNCMNEMKGITLEMGKDAPLEELLERYRMVDWVGPHEIGHGIDWNIGHEADNVAKAMHHNIQALTCQMDGGDIQKSINDAITTGIKESFIDGLGFRLARSYGTSDPADETEKQRTGRLADSFIATMSVLQRILEKQAVDHDSRCRCSILVLRMQNNAVSLLDSLDAASPVRQSLQECLAHLQQAFAALNETTGSLNPEQADAVRTLFRSAFGHAQQVSLTTIAHPEGSHNI